MCHHNMLLVHFCCLPHKCAWLTGNSKAGPTLSPPDNMWQSKAALRRNPCHQQKRKLAALGSIAAHGMMDNPRMHVYSRVQTQRASVHVARCSDTPVEAAVCSKRIILKPHQRCHNMTHYQLQQQPAELNFSSDCSDQRVSPQNCPS